MTQLAEKKSLDATDFWIPKMGAVITVHLSSFFDVSSCQVTTSQGPQGCSKGGDSLEHGDARHGLPLWTSSILSFLNYVFLGPNSGDPVVINF